MNPDKPTVERIIQMFSNSMNELPVEYNMGVSFCILQLQTVLEMMRIREERDNEKNHNVTNTIDDN